MGNIGPISRLGFDGLCLQDGPLAIREATYASVFPAGLSVAASWDRDLAHQRGIDMALEFKGKGSHIALGPVAGPLGRRLAMPVMIFYLCLDADIFVKRLRRSKLGRFLARPLPHRRAFCHHHRGHAVHRRPGLRQTLHRKRTRDPTQPIREQERHYN